MCVKLVCFALCVVCLCCVCAWYLSVLHESSMSVCGASLRGFCIVCGFVCVCVSMCYVSACWCAWCVLVLVGACVCV